MTDFRVSVEEIALEFEIKEMALSIIREAMEQEEMEESPLTTTIRLHCHNSLGKITEEQTELPF